MDYRLMIGTKQTSSWSLRPWLLMRQAGIPFTEEVVRLREPDTAAKILARSPAGLVPALIIRDTRDAESGGEETVWDSLAIAETLAERHPDRGLWPADARARARARAITAEMHAGFRDLRMNLPMYVLKSGLPCPVDDGVTANIRRIVAMWRDTRAQYGAQYGEGSPFLFGRFSIADAFYAPVASRFATYSVDLAAHGDDGTAAAYRDTMMTLATMQDWIAGAKAEVPVGY